MNIDFHYGAMFALARLAGIPREQALTIAHACQYVDDATMDGILKFQQGERYARVATAHAMLDFHTLDRNQDSQCWVPFHFLPAGLGETTDEKAVCRPDSAPARALIAAAIAARGRPNGPHRLGIALHTYVDTFAHQGFAGIPSGVNIVRELHCEEDPCATWRDRVRQEFAHVEATTLDDLFDATAALRGGLLVGHGAALTYPDRPWARWSYVNGHGQTVKRDNLPDFLKAADMAYRILRAWHAGGAAFEGPGLAPPSLQGLREVLSASRVDDPEVRLDAFARALQDGRIPPLAEDLPAYIAKGPGSWKYAATGLESGDDRRQGTGELPEWRPAFETSDYRHFHDAVKESLVVITQEILPAHGVRLA